PHHGARRPSARERDREVAGARELPVGKGARRAGVGMTAPRGTPISERAFALLLRLFPATFRQRFGQDMRELFRDQARAARQRGGTRAVLRLWMQMVPSLARAAAVERADAVRTAVRELRSQPLTMPFA